MAPAHSKAKALKTHQDFYALHLGNGHVLLVLEAAVHAPIFDDTGVWALMAQLRHGRRKRPEVLEAGTGHACICKGCDHCKVDGMCGKMKRSRNYCYGCSPHHAEGCSFNHHTSPTHQSCAKGSQGLNAVGLDMCQRHTLRELGMHVGNDLAVRLRAYAGASQSPLLLMAEAPQPALLPSAVQRVQIRCRGAGNSHVITFAEIMKRPILRDSHNAFLRQICKQVESLLRQMYDTFSNDDWGLPWVQTVTATFGPEEEATLSITGPKVFDP